MNKVVDTQELLPCPFCKRKAAKPQYASVHSKAWVIWCGGCGASGGSADTIAEAIRAWNTRSTQCSGDTQELATRTLEAVREWIVMDRSIEPDEWPVTAIDRLLRALRTTHNPSDKTAELLREARAWVSSAEHDEDCELHPEYGEQNLEASNSEAEEAALEAGGDECDVRYRTYPDDAVCTCERGRFLAKIDSHLGEMKNTQEHTK